MQEKSRTCPRCGYQGPPTERGLCPKCGQRLGPARALGPGLPVRPAVYTLGRPDEPKLFFIAAGMVLFAAGTRIFEAADPVLLPLAGQGVVLLGLLVLALLSSQDPPPYLARCRLRKIDLHGHPGARVEVAIHEDYLARGDRVELSIQLRTQHGAWLRARRAPYQDPQGRFRAAQVSAPYSEERREPLPVAVAFPFAALDLVARDEPWRLVAVVEIFDGEEVVVQRELFLRIPGRAAGLLALEVDPAGVEVVEVCGGEAATCMVCGDDLAGGPARRCPACDTPHHPECWEYNAGCSTFGCRGLATPEAAGEKTPPAG